METFLFFTSLQLSYLSLACGSYSEGVGTSQDHVKSLILSLTASPDASARKWTQFCDQDNPTSDEMFLECLSFFEDITEYPYSYGYYDNRVDMDNDDVSIANVCHAWYPDSPELSEFCLLYYGFSDDAYAYAYAYDDTFYYYDDDYYNVNTFDADEENLWPNDLAKPIYESWKVLLCNQLYPDTDENDLFFSCLDELQSEEMVDETADDYFYYYYYSSVDEEKEVSNIPSSVKTSKLIYDEEEKDSLFDSYYETDIQKSNEGGYDVNPNKEGLWSAEQDLLFQGFQLSMYIEEVIDLMEQIVSMYYQVLLHDKLYPDTGDLHALTSRPNPASVLSQATGLRGSYNRN